LDPEESARRQRLLALSNGSDAEFDAALITASIERARQFIRGVRSYHNHSARREDWFDHNDKTGTILWQAGTTVLRDYNPAHPEAPTVRVIPSLINRFDIVDLDSAQSFLRALAEEGLRPLVVDWNAPGVQEKDFSLSDYVTKRLIPILDFVTEEGAIFQDTAFGNEKKHSYQNPDSRPPIPKCHLLGYCMGGLLALALASLRPQQTRTLALMATPWDFHKPDPAIGPHFRALAEHLKPCLGTLNYLPVDVIQSLFALFQPLQALTKFTGFSAIEPHSMEARQFVLLKDWLNDGVPLTASAARECLNDWYGENRTAKFEWRVDGKTIDPREITVPSYVVVPGRDLIVPPESALPLAKLLPHAALHEPMTGHIGMIASQKAPQQVWAPLFHWFAQHA
jgi:polyhydroxyalkanoate synthase